MLHARRGARLATSTARGYGVWRVALPPLAPHARALRHLTRHRSFFRAAFPRGVTGVLAAQRRAPRDPSPRHTAPCHATSFALEQDIPRRCTVIYCNTCGKYLQPPKHWLRAELESKELLTFCVKRLKGLNKLKLVDAGFIWTEPHSKQLKVKLTVQAEVLNGAILQQSCVVDYTVVYNMCGECIRANANPDQWVATVQVRQKVDHKRTFLFLEQLILKHGADRRTINVKDNADGLDFFFKSKSHALSFVDFLTQVVPARQGKDSKELVSHDEHTSNYRYKFSFYCEIAHPCKDDLVCFDRRQTRALGGFGPLAIVTRVSNNLQFTDPATLRQVWLDSTQYWRSPPGVIQATKQLVEYIVLDIEPVRGEYGRPVSVGPHVLADAEVVKASEFGHTDGTMHIRTHMGGVLKPGDTALGYDLASANFNTSELDSHGGTVDLPDVVLVRKSFAEKRRRRKNRARNWQLKTLANRAGMDVDDEDAAAGADGPSSGARGRGKGRARQNAADAAAAEQRERDLERFMEEIEEDPELRSRINLYKNPEAGAMAATGGDEDDDSEGVPEVPLEELLDALTMDDIAGAQQAPDGNGADDMDM